MTFILLVLDIFLVQKRSEKNKNKNKKLITVQVHVVYSFFTVGATTRCSVGTAFVV
jgi:hypothetical protein